jgi:membrane protein implicated in regulation of membrane protease activity
MIWIGLACFAGLAVVTVSAWARTARRRVEAAEAERRERRRLQTDEETLLARLNAKGKD